MKKQVILAEEEYEALVLIAALATMVLDKAVGEFKGECHLTDSPECPPVLKSIYAKLLWIPDAIKSDIVHHLPPSYIRKHWDSVLSDGD